MVSGLEWEKYPLQFEKLLRNLNRRDLPMEVREPFYKLGKVAYDELFSRLDQVDLTDRQIQHMLWLLFDLRAVGDKNILFETFLAFTQDTRIRVRSAAVHLVALIVRNSDPPARLEFRRARDPDILNVLRKGLALGLDRPTEDGVRMFLDNPSITGDTDLTR
jgi:hypothetical protein